MRNITITAICLALAFATPAFSQAEKVGTKAGEKAGDAKLSTKEQTFMKTAAADGMAEVKLGNMAKEKGSNEHVKHFGEMMVTDHSKANEELKALAASKGVELPADISKKHQAVADKLAKLEGEQFDKAYAAEMVKDHKKSVSDFETAAKTAKDPEVKAFAEKNLPTLRTHLEHAQKMSAEQKGGKGAAKKAGAGADRGATGADADKGAAVKSGSEADKAANKAAE